MPARAASPDSLLRVVDLFLEPWQTAVSVKLGDAGGDPEASIQIMGK